VLDRARPGAGAGLPLLCEAEARAGERWCWSKHGS